MSGEVWKIKKSLGSLLHGLIRTLMTNESLERLRCLFDIIFRNLVSCFPAIASIMAFWEPLAHSP
jgi:hypothetical protein